MKKTESHIVKSGLPCDDCGSRRGLTYYSNYTTHCFACDANGKWDEADVEDPPTNTKKKPKPLLDEDETRPIKKTHRNISPKTFDKCGVVLADLYNPKTEKKESASVYPFYDRMGIMIGQKIRFADKTFLSRGDISKKNPMFCQQLCSGGNKDKIIITEGEIDCLTIRELYPNLDVVSLQCGAKSAKITLAENLNFLMQYAEIVLCFDNDKDGQEAIQNAIWALPVEKVYIAKSEYKDANEAYERGGKKAVADLAYNAQKYQPDNVIGGSQLWDAYLNVVPPKTYDYPFPQLNELLGGITSEELILIAGVSGGGKSTLCSQIAYHLLKTHGATIGYIALEESPKTSAERFISLEMRTKVSTRTEKPSEEYKEAYKTLMGSDKVFFTKEFGSLSVDYLLSTMRYLVKAKNCQYLFLDHLSILLSGNMGDSNQQQVIDEAMTALQKFVMDTGVCLFVVSHLNSQDGINPHQDEGGSKFLSLEQGGIPTIGHLRGSRGIAQLSDSVITFGRNVFDNEDEVILWVVKNRRMGSTGRADTLNYNSETTWFDNADDNSKLGF